MKSYFVKTSRGEGTQSSSQKPREERGKKRNSACYSRDGCRGKKTYDSI